MVQNHNQSLLEHPALLLLEVHKDELDYVSEMVVKNMKDAIELDVPVEIDCGFGPSWYEAH
jgi:DNA polymerase-1